MRINKLFLLFFFLHLVGFSQDIKGVVFDSQTGEPLEGASVYFDNTTIGTTTNEKGEFSLNIDESVRSALIISFIGYEKVVMEEYKPGSILKIQLTENVASLNEVNLSFNDGWTRKQKLQAFKRYFLGNSENALSCEIKNEDALILRYLGKSNQLVASSKEPLIIENKRLKYRISYDLQDFNIQYEKNDTFGQVFPISVYYAGTSFYQTDENWDGSKKIINRRKEVYFGSSLHFMRSLVKGKLHEEGFRIFYKKTEIAQTGVFAVSDTDKTNIKEIKIFKQPLLIVYNNNFNNQSSITTKEDVFYVDEFGNHMPSDAVMFTGYFANQRIGDSLPLNFEADKK
ncbi:carboxypeptidase-like regulatory domain-containing protein [Mangrovimonas sp. AS39]|uniref:carboxypeptidase-like regulatory domain-containing protein n=1 Tax=Mangrovimonas futianensis TaxID=2895523 RepID=UPI001E4FB251|nr:carboxypeptidase-like regulatory domain-containing protein [Mangrovimonas futianensis]MCF1190133.1 carboxypeptidase-like regulatory domain-containing protein [Mangrovimonas futianensis]MCF1194116.1 carboxypeptidase-like regulatory domain-containing protein [Mangrovimonas futianensis]